MRSSVIFILVTLFGVSVCSKAAVYVDNGMDQTAIDRALTRAEKSEMELEILNLLGLPKRPRRISQSLKKSTLIFLMDVYKSLTEKDDENSRAKRHIDGGELDLSQEEQSAIEESDVIMTFETINHHVSDVRHEKGKRLWFNVTEVPVAEDVLGAELRIFQDENSAKQRKSKGVYTVTVYELLINNESGFRERELEYIAAINTTTHFTGWLKFNITQCLPSWEAFPNSNRGLYLSVHPVDKPGHEVRPDQIGLMTMGGKGEDETQPFMVAFLKNSNRMKAKRSTRNANLSLKRRVKKSDYTTMMKNQQYETWRTCKIHTLYISFKDLKWQDWIIAPEGYAASYCAGECNFPLNAHMNATNHAIVQTLVHLMSPTRYPKPCCAPTKLTPISVLYFDDDTSVVLKKYKKMVVKSCGCH